MNDPRQGGGNPAADRELAAIARALANGAYGAAAAGAIRLLEREPRLAQAWVYWGEALLRQGQGASARRVFRRALLLDPMAPWAEAAERASREAPEGAEHPDVDRLLAAERPTVAAAILTRNEARCIGRCLDSLQGVFDEILVVDSDSSDGTIEIAARYPEVRVVQTGETVGGFAALRNFGLGHLHADWVFWIDADEWLDPDDREAVREAAGLFHRDPEPVVLTIVQVNYVRGGVFREYGTQRMFPLRRNLRYDGKVHEQVVRGDGGGYDGGLRRVPVRIRLHHDGYESGPMREKGKLERNMALLREMMRERPTDPAWPLYAGRESMAAGDAAAAEAYLLEAERLAATQPRFARKVEIYRLLLHLCLDRQELERALGYCEKALEIQPDFPDALFALAQIRMRLAAEQLKRSEEALLQAKQAFRTYRGTVAADAEIMEWKADAALGDLARMTGRSKRARELYAAVLKRKPELAPVLAKLQPLEEEGDA